MDRTKGEWVDLETLHLRIAERSAALPRPVDWRTGRDLGLVVSLAVLLPVTLFAVEVGVGPGLAGGLCLALAAVGAAGYMAVCREYAIQPLTLPTNETAGAGRRGAPGLRVIPRHHVQPRSRVRAAQPGRPRPIV